MKLVRLIAINLAVFFLLLALLEGALRVAYPGLHSMGSDYTLFRAVDGGYAYAPNARGYAHGALFEIDADGFRKFSSTPADHRDKILLVMGDSVTVGVGVQADAIYPALLDKELTSSRVVNAAVSGYGFSDYVVRLRKLLPELRPEGVVLGLCLNDLSRTSQTNIVAELKDRRKTWDDYVVRYPNPIIRTLRYADDNYLGVNRYLNRYWLTSIWLKNMFADSPKNHFLAEYAMYERPDAPSRLRDELSAIQTLVRANGAWLQLMVFPYEYQMRVKDPQLFSPQRLITETAKSLGISILDPIHVMVGRPSEDLFLYVDPAHFSASGHKIVEQTLREHLVSAGRVSVRQ